MGGENMGANPERSTFVTVVAWVFIAIAGFSSFAALLENVLFNALAGGGGLPPELGNLGQYLPPMAAFIFHNLRWFLLALLVASIVTLTAAIGLLRRRDWARRLFIGLMAASILWNLGGLVLQQVFVSDAPTLAGMQTKVPADIRSGLQVFQTVMTVVSALTTLAIVALLVWVVKRLMSPRIREEFS